MFDFSDLQQPDVVIWTTLNEDSSPQIGADVTVEIPLLMKKYKKELEKLEGQGFWVHFFFSGNSAKVSHPGIDAVQVAERLAAGFEAQGLTVLRQITRLGKNGFITPVSSFILT